MPTWHALRQFDQIAQKWRDLAERRRAYYVELYRSGRWKHYYSEEHFVVVMRDVMAVTERWEALAPKPVDNAAVASDAETIEITRRAA